MKAKYIITVCISMVVFMSCDDDFLERPPLTEPAAETFYASESEAIMGVTGVYNSLYTQNHLFEWEDVCTDNERWNADGSNATYGGLAHALETAVGNNGYHRRMWGKGYEMVQRVNLAIENIEPMDNISDNTKNELIAQCRFLRGWAYHWLIWRFGDVPLLLNPTSEQEFQPVRDPKEDIVEQIYSDYEFAAQYLPSTWTGSDIGRVTKGAALGMLAKEYLFNEEWENAAAAAKEVMDNSSYGLVDNYLDLWTPGINNTKEGLFEIQYWTSSDEYAPDYYYRWLKGTAANTGASGSGWCLVVQDLVNAFENIDGTAFDPTGIDVTSDDSQYENRDPRMQYTIFVNGQDYYGQPFDRSWSETGYAWRKYSCAKNDELLLGGTNIPINWKVLRYAEVLLIYAEAKNESDGPVDAVYEAVNQVRNRVGMPDLPAGLSQDEMRERIYNERRVELASEGTRLEDLIRWRRLEEALENKHLNYGVNYQISDFEEFRYLWPIPQNEIDVNPNLVQNPGY
jgi:hypothetical protein